MWTGFWIIAFLIVLIGCGAKSSDDIGLKEGDVVLGPLIPPPPIQSEWGAEAWGSSSTLDAMGAGQQGLTALDQAWLADDTERFQAAVLKALELQLFPSDESVDVIVWEEPVTRGEFAFWLMGFSGEASSRHLLQTYQDVERDNPYYGMIEDVTERGWMQGVLEGQTHRFFPEQPLTREQLAKALVVLSLKLPVWKNLQTAQRAHVPTPVSEKTVSEYPDMAIRLQPLPLEQSELPDAELLDKAYAEYVISAINAPWFPLLFQQHRDDVTGQGFSPKQPVSKDMALMAIYGLMHLPIVEEASGAGRSTQTAEE